MKKHRIFAISILMAFAHSLVASDNVIITGNVSAIPDSTEVILIQYEGRVGTGIAMDTIKDGKFCLSLPIDSGLSKTTLRLIKDNKSSRERELYLRPGAKVEIDAPDPFVETWNVKSNVPEQFEFDRFVTASKDILDLLQQDNGFTHSVLNTSNSNPKPISKLNLNETLRDSLVVVNMQRDMDLLEKMPVSTVWLDKMEDLARSFRFYDAYSENLKDRLQKLYNNLNESEKNSKQAVIAYTILNPPAKLRFGDTISDEEFIDIDGSRHRLSEFRDKWVLLDFWSSGCYSSIMAFPELKRFKEENGDQVEVVSLSIDHEKTWKDASDRIVKIEGNNWNECKEDMGLFQKFGANGTPTFVLISPEGEIKSKWKLYGNGSFGRQFRLLSREKGYANYLDIDGGRSVNNPVYDYNETIGLLDIDRVDISENGTKVYFFANDKGIVISPDTYLITDDGTKLKLIGSEGITPGQEFNLEENGTGHFSLTYEPLPQETQYFTYVMEPGGYLHIKNIHVK